MFNLFDETKKQVVIQDAINDIHSLFQRNQVLLNCLQQVKKLTELDINHPDKLSLIESYAFNRLTTQTILNYSLEKLEQLIMEIMKHQNQISNQHHAFMNLQEHHSIFEHNQLFRPTP
jgi:hypothetical protein